MSHPTCLGFARPITLLALAAIILAPAACEESASAPGEEKLMTITLTSPAFKANDRIPVKYTGEGDDVSPPLDWAGAPAAAKGFAVICDDPDAPVGTWDHWLIWNIPADRKGLPEGVAKTETVADLGGARQGNNSWPKIGYWGPMPPKGHGNHHYIFRVYALDQELDLKAGSNKKALEAAMKGHVVGEGKLVGVYSR